MDKVIDTQELRLDYGDFNALRDISLPIYRNKVTALIGPSGCGKSTFLRCLNRMNDLIDNVKVEGIIRFNGEQVQGVGVDVIELRKKVGMVFQKPNPFPMSIFDNVAYGPRQQGIKNKDELRGIVEKALKQAALYNEVKDRMNESATRLSGGQQQRLCIARALAMEPEVLLIRARPFGYPTNRRVDRGVEERLYDRHCDSLYAAGSADFRQYSIFLTGRDHRVWSYFRNICKPER
jgi:phosphate transport system ATP-binding protein